MYAKQYIAYTNRVRCTLTFSHISGGVYGIPVLTLRTVVPTALVMPKSISFTCSHSGSKSTMFSGFTSLQDDGGGGCGRGLNGGTRGSGLNGGLFFLLNHMVLYTYVDINIDLIK